MTLDAYHWHSKGRELASALQIPLVWLSSAGQYRVTLALYREQPQHPVFQGKIQKIYQTQNPLGVLAQRMFVPSMWRQTPETANVLPALRRSGSGLQSFAGYGMQAPLLFRLGINISALSDETFWKSKATFPERGAIALDTASLFGGLVQNQFYIQGLRKLNQGAEFTARAWFLRNHRLNIAGSSMQAVAGSLRLGLEVQRYFETGQLNASAAYYGALDGAGGIGGVVYSRYLLNQARTMSRVAACNNSLMGLTPLPFRLRWGLRGLGLAASVVGLGLSLHAFTDTAFRRDLPQPQRRRQMVSSGLGIAGSGMMMVSALMITPATAPLAGLVLIGGMAVLIGQAVYDAV